MLPNQPFIFFWPLSRTISCGYRYRAPCLTGHSSDHHILIQVLRIPQQFVRSIIMSRCRTYPMFLFKCSFHSLKTFVWRRMKPPILIPCDLDIAHLHGSFTQYSWPPHLHTSPARSRDMDEYEVFISEAYEKCEQFPESRTWHIQETPLYLILLFSSPQTFVILISRASLHVRGRPKRHSVSPPANSQKHVASSTIKNTVKSISKHCFEISRSRSVSRAREIMYDFKLCYYYKRGISVLPSHSIDKIS